MTDFPLILILLVAVTFAIRLSGFWLGRRLPVTGAWAQAFAALPGCLILALVVIQLLQGGPAEWGAGLVALVVAMLTRNLPLTMVAGILAVLAFRAVI